MDGNMKLSEYLIGVGRPVAYYPGLRKITGSTNATIFLCQFVYWIGKESSGDGWIYKTSDEIEKETGLSYDEQRTAREKLVKSSLLHERYARLEHQMYYQVDLQALNEKWGNPQLEIPEHGNAKMGNTESEQSLNSNAEITTETTTSTEPSKPKTSLSKENIQKANQLVDAILGNACKSQASWSGRDKFPEPIRDLLDVFVQLTDLRPTKREHMIWLVTGQDWLDAGITVQDLKDAHTYAIRPERGFIVCSPHSLTKTAAAMAAKRRQQQQAAEVMPTQVKDSISRWEGKKFVPRPDNLPDPRKVK